MHIRMKQPNIILHGDGIDLGAKSKDAKYYQYLNLSNVNNIVFVDYFSKDKNMVDINLEENSVFQTIHMILFSPLIFLSISIILNCLFRSHIEFLSIKEKCTLWFPFFGDIMQTHMIIFDLHMKHFRKADEG